MPVNIRIEGGNLNNQSGLKLLCLPENPDTINISSNPNFFFENAGEEGSYSNDILIDNTYVEKGNLLLIPVNVNQYGEDYHGITYYHHRIASIKGWGANPKVWSVFSFLGDGEFSILVGVSEPSNFQSLRWESSIPLSASVKVRFEKSGSQYFAYVSRKGESFNFTTNAFKFFFTIKDYWGNIKRFVVWVAEENKRWEQSEGKNRVFLYGFTQPDVKLAFLLKNVRLKDLYISP